MVTAAGPLMKKLLSTLGARVTALTLAVVLATAAVGSIAAVLLVQRANDAAATRSLSAMADVAQSLATLAASPEMGLARARRALAGVQVQVAVVRSETARGTVVAGDPLPRRLLTDAMLAQLLAGQDVSLRVPDDDGPVFLEGRATEAGAIVLAQRRNDAVALGQDALTRLRWAFAAVALLSVLVGWAMSRRVTTPLRRMADAAADLAAGSRDVAVPETGPAEVAAVGTALNELARSLAHSEARQREFLLSVSHDLRTPLTAVTGYAESLADGVIPADGVADIGRIVAPRQPAWTASSATCWTWLAWMLTRCHSPWSRSTSPGCLPPPSQCGDGDVRPWEWCSGSNPRARRWSSRLIPTGCVRRSTDSWTTPCAPPPPAGL